MEAVDINITAGSVSVMERVPRLQLIVALPEPKRAGHSQAMHTYSTAFKTTSHVTFDADPELSIGAVPWAGDCSRVSGTGVSNGHHEHDRPYFA